MEGPADAMVEAKDKNHDGAPKVAVVKKYTNRRLYNTATSSYVTLDDLSKMVRQGEHFVVYDAKSDEDLTRSILTQIILAKQRRSAIGMEQESLPERRASLDREKSRSSWSNPIVVAILGASLAGIGNAGVALINGYQSQYTEKQKAEDGRLLEAIKTGNPDAAAVNLQFLLDLKLISNPETVAHLDTFLAKRKPGTGPSLPVLAVQAGFLRELISDSSHRIFLAAGVRPPPCDRGVSLPDKLSLPSNLNPLQRTAAEAEYDYYKMRCKELQ
jgi:hypothetical protein